jgi:hypothetical protein
MENMQNGLDNENVHFANEFMQCNDGHGKHSF